MVPREEIAAGEWDLSVSRYKAVVLADATHKSPREIIDSLAIIEKEISAGLAALKEMFA